MAGAIGAQAIAATATHPQVDRLNLRIASPSTTQQPHDVPHPTRVCFETQRYRFVIALLARREIIFHRLRD